MKELVDYTFHELVDYHASQALDDLLTGGGKELKNRIFLAMQNAIDWRKAKDEAVVVIDSRYKKAKPKSK